VFDVRVEVEEVRGFCDLPMRPGDYFEVRGSRLTIPEGKFMCIWALQSLLPMIPLKQRAIAETNDWVNHTHRMICPDPNGLVVYRFIRLGQDGAAVAEVGTTPPIPSRMLVGASCTGCKKCEEACRSVWQGVPEDARLSRIWVARPESPASRPAMDRYEVRVCRQCGNAPCVEACSPRALRRNLDTGAIEIDMARCTLCGACETACRFGAIRVLGGKVGGAGRVLVCDLCGGSPKCVGQCPTGAIWYGLAGDAHGLTGPAPENGGRPK
jgi:uncharacterized repeat protein (TIGR04076 family)